MIKFEQLRKYLLKLIHVKKTSSLTPKSGNDDLFAKFGLSLKNVRGKSYDGQVNGEFNGLRLLVFTENNNILCPLFCHQF